MNESQIMRRVMLALSTAGATIFRNQVGVAYQGHAEHISQTKTIIVGPGDVVVRNARTIRSGLHVGASDLIGFHRGRFIACEVKSATGKLSKEQRQFLEIVRDDGGIAIVARSEEEALRGLE